jgi:integrase
MKAGHEHRVPLSEPAMAVLRSVAQFGVESFVFGLKAASMLSDVALTRAVHEAGGNGATVHGMRSSFRDWCAETTTYPRELAEAALAHTLRDKAEAAYQRGDLLEKRRRLMAEWASFCGREMVAREVVTLRTAG